MNKNIGSGITQPWWLSINHTWEIDDNNKQMERKVGDREKEFALWESSKFWYNFDGDN